MNKATLLGILVVFCIYKGVPLFSSNNHGVADTFNEQECLPESFLRTSLKSHFEIEQTLISFANKNFVIRDCLTNNRWVLRVPHEVSNLLSDREQEMALLEWGYREGMSLLQVKDYDPETGYLLTHFLSGQAQSTLDFQNPANLQEAVKLLYRLHSSKTVPISTQFHPLSRFVVTSKVALRCGLSLPQEIRELADQLTQFLSQIPPSHFQSVPCHNDPSPANFFSQNGSLYLHDWELAGFNDPMWDLTQFSVLGQIDPERVLRFYPNSDPLALEKMTFFSPFILFNSLVWSSLERQQPFSSLPQLITERLYQTFLEQITDSVKSHSFQQALQKLIQGDF